MSRIILILLGMVTVFGVAYTFEPDERTVIKITDVRAGTERQKLEDYLYQGFWSNKLVWKPKWVKTWQEKITYVPSVKRIWQSVEEKEWVTKHPPPPSWVYNVDGDFAVKLPE